MKVFKENIPIPSPEKLSSLVSASFPSCWLDSAMSEHPRGRYSIFAYSPLATLRVDAGGQGVLTVGESSRRIEQAFQFLESWLHSFYPQFSSQEEFCGGAIGFLSYESYAQRFKLVPRSRERNLPDAFFMLIDSGMVIDHRQQRAWVFSLGIREDLQSFDQALAQKRIAQLCEQLSTKQERSTNTIHVMDFESHLTRDVYLEKVETIREAIYRGDCYQVNFAQKFSVQGEWDVGEIYLKLRSVSAAPQMVFLNLGDFQVLSASPEILLETKGTTATSYPIKGTRPRSQQSEQDKTFAQDLLQSEKDAAELLMIVDLVRNDLGKFCETGSVRVPVMKTLESFPQVHHLVASIEGKMRREIWPLQALLEMSPGGSITGAPKLKAMEIIHQLEEVPRGIYTGSIGYMGFNQRSCFNIAIRTAICCKNRLEYFAGGGIVADSIPEAEYEETLQKAEGFFQALGIKR